MIIQGRGCELSGKGRGNPNILNIKRKDYYNEKVVPKWEMIGGWARSGLANTEIARNLGIGESTFTNYLSVHEELSDWVRECREDAEVQVENALFKKATGYDIEEVTRERREINGVSKLIVTKRVTKHIQPDVGAAQYWLEHRAPNKWVKNPTVPVDTDGINTQIAGLAVLIANPMPVREIGSENE